MPKRSRESFSDFNSLNHWTIVQTSTIQSIKLAIVEATGLSKDALHVYVGLAVFLAIAAVSRRRIRSIVPWLAVAAVAIAGEAIDMIDDLSSLGHWRWDASLHDVVNTLFWPTAIWLLARYRIVFAESKKRE
jgi:hypothetical protein